MISENQVELVIKYNLRAKSHLRDNQFLWNPSSTSTPIRKPLHPLTNLEVISDCKQYNYLSSHNNRYVIPSKVNKLQDNDQINKRNSLEKDKDEDFCYVLSSDEDESDTKKNKMPKKNLVIKLGNSCNKNSKNKINKNIFEIKHISPPEGKFEFEINGNNTGHVIEDDVKDLKVNNLDEKNDVQIIDNKIKEISTNYVSINENDANGQPAEELTDVKSNRDKKLNNKNTSKVSSKKRKDMDTLLKHAFVKKFKTVENLNDLSNVNKNKVRKISKNLNSSKNLKINSDIEKILDAKNIIQNPNHSDKSSTSHEIFSDSKEQELRDSLNLTNSDIEESCRIDNGQGSCSKGQKMQKLLKHKNLANRKNRNASKINAVNSSVEVVQQKRTIKMPREYWLPRSETFDTSSSKEHILQNEKYLSQRKEDFVKTSSSMQSSSSKTVKNKIVKSNKKQTNEVLKNSFIKDVSKMKFIKKVKGGNHEFLAAVGWELSTFKCCVLKITKNSEIVGRTKEKNSHCGGVILKGRLLMKIQDEEMEVKQGQIFHIPPLTDWKMVNNGRAECTVYYWRGRF